MNQRSLLFCLLFLCLGWLSLAPGCSKPTTQETPSRQEASITDASVTTENGPTESGISKKDKVLLSIDTFIATRKINTSSAGWRLRLPKPPQATFESGRTYYWMLKTNKGMLKIALMPSVAPMHVTSTIYLTKLGFYDSLTFHRVIKRFMAQGGDPLGNGRGGPGYKYAGEFSASVTHNRAGLLSMANAGPNTDGSQFFITFVPTSHLNGKHTIFGEVKEGMDTLKALEAAGSATGRTSEKLFIEKATIVVE